jgi:hypothetical protein
MTVYKLEAEAVDWLRPPNRKDSNKPWRFSALARMEDPEKPVVTFYHACGHVSEVDYSKVRPVCKRMSVTGLRVMLRGNKWWWIPQGINAPCPYCNHGGSFTSRQNLGKRKAGYRKAGTWVRKKE